VIPSTADFYLRLAFSFGCMSGISLGAALLSWLLFVNYAEDGDRMVDEGFKTGAEG